MILRIMQIFLLLVSCSDNKQEDVAGKYFTDNEESYISIANADDKGIINGIHCFVSFNGERIDCCVDEEFSIIMQKKGKTEYDGILSSCYDELEYEVIVSFEKKTLNLVFKDKSHPFIAREVTLKKRK